MPFPVVMVHGMCCTGAVWHNFRAYFEARGARVFTPTLRPRERLRVGAPTSLGRVRLKDYLEELIEELERVERDVGERPVLIGHSMGGLLGQLVAERNLVGAAVFISPSPPVGARDLVTRAGWVGMRALSRAGLMPAVIQPRFGALDRVALNVADRAAIVRARAGTVAESGRAFMDIARCEIDETRIRVPVLTVSAGCDRIVPAYLTRRTGRKYAPVGGELIEYARHGHWLYDEPGWERPAGDIFRWLERTTRGARAARGGPGPLAVRSA